MIDESMDTDAMKKEPQPWEFRTKKAWQRLLVMVGGVLYNFVFAIIAYIGIMAIWGSAYISNEGSQIYTNELGTELGSRTATTSSGWTTTSPRTSGCSRLISRAGMSTKSQCFVTGTPSRSTSTGR